MSARVWLRRLMGEELTSSLHARRWARMLPRNCDPATRHVDLPWVGLIDRLLEPGDTALDIGAHGGGFSYPMAIRVAPTGTVHAFEILPYYRKTLEKTMKLLDVYNVEIHPFGIGTSDREIELVVADAQGNHLTGNVHIRGPEEVSARSETARIRSLDELANERPELGKARFVKIDVTGAELEVLEGGRRFFGAHQPRVLAQVTKRQTARYGHDVASVLDAFEALGYVSARLEPVGCRLRSELGPTPPSGDWLLVPAEHEAELQRITRPE